MKCMDGWWAATELWLAAEHVCIASMVKTDIYLMAIEGFRREHPSSLHSLVGRRAVANEWLLTQFDLLLSIPTGRSTLEAH
jgi:hypothetical protein